ncbi:MAG TPA: tetratricopeptide repeat protein, partial [Thermomicrobiales bacterium]|nr:tetratricopeptide repeat protein [Thermomicrobiales bacterium]
ALGVREVPDHPLAATLAAVLRDRLALLVLDNCEHLVDACAALAEALLRAAPRLRVLATSREVLRVGGEVVWPVPPLALPATDATSAAAVARSAAGRLFAERARAVRPDFALTDRNAPAVAAVCRRLDGLPLALELAAARVAAVTVEQLAPRLDDRFRLLDSGSRAAPSRQQTLRATVEWSYALLGAQERRLFARLAVFAGGWTLEAVEAICGGDDGEDGAMLAPLARLVDQSLVVVEAGPGGEARYRLLETLRQYAAERLAASGEAAAVGARHAAHYLALAEAAAGALRGPEVAAWLDRLEADHDNLRAAFARALATGKAATALRLVGALRWFWLYRGPYSEGERWAAAALAAGAAPLALRAGALLVAGHLAAERGDDAAGQAAVEEARAAYAAFGDRRGQAEAVRVLGLIAQHGDDVAATRAYLGESLALYRTLGDRLGASSAMCGLATRLARDGAAGPARELIEEALALARAVGQPHHVAWCLRIAGIVEALAGDLAVARAHTAEALAYFRALGSRVEVAMALNNLGAMALHAGDPAAARPLLEEAVAIHRELGARGGAMALWGLAEVEHRAGDSARARPLLAAALREGAPLGVEWGLADGIELAAGVLGAGGEATAAARLFGAAAAWRRASGGPPRAPDDETDYQRNLAAARTGLDAAAWAAAWAAGQRLTLEQARAEALAALEAGDVAAPPASGRR